MSYGVNGVDFTIQPTTGRWLPLAPVGITANGTPIYPGVRMFEIRWNLLDATSTNQLMTFFGTIGFTGTAVVSLPQFGAATYTFYSYSGCTLYQPDFGVYFSEHTQDIVMLVGNVVT